MTKRYGVVVFAGLCLGLFVKLFCVDMLKVSGSSMIPSLTDGEYVVVNKLAYGLVKPFGNSFFIQWSEPKSGHLVVFLHDNKMVVKRCAAISGERLDFSSDNDYNLILGGKRIHLSFEQYEKMSQFSEVPDGYCLVLGDNSLQSVDSRDYGFVSKKNITGKIIGK